MTDYTKLSDQAIFSKKPSDMDEAERELFEFKSEEAADELMHRMRNTPELRHATIMKLAQRVLRYDDQSI